MKKISLFLSLLALSIGQMLLFSSCQPEETLPAPISAEESIDANARVSGKPKKVMLAQHPTLGNYLTDQDGRTLYFLPMDVSGTSACLNRCTGQWPVFESKHIRVSEGLNAGDFAVINRPDGKKQVTFKGWPLYYFSGDTMPGEVNGNGFQERGFVAKPDYTVMLADQPLEAFGGAITRYMTDAQGRTLYFFMLDPNNESVCNDNCAQYWPTYTNTENLTIPSTLDASLFSVVTRADGRKQLAYLGMPLYYYAEDTKRGEAKGQSIQDWAIAHLNWL